VLMITGIALFGFLAGSLASFFVERREEEKIDPQLDELKERTVGADRECITQGEGGRK
jgi:hypothetical protein